MVPHGSAATGTDLSKARACRLNFAGSILLPLNPKLVASVLPRPAPRHEVDTIVLKSPASTSAVGTIAVEGEGVDRCRVAWYPAKNISLSLTSGPPTVPPN